MSNEPTVSLLWYFLGLFLFAVTVLMIIWLAMRVPDKTTEHQVASNTDTATDSKESLKKPRTLDSPSLPVQKTEIHTQRKHATYTIKGTTMEKWEYAVVTYSYGSMIGERAYVWTMEDTKIKQKKGYTSKMPLLEALSQLGQDGWEAVTSSTGAVSTHPGNDTIVVVLKRLYVNT